MDNEKETPILISKKLDDLLDKIIQTEKQKMDIILKLIPEYYK